MAHILLICFAGNWDIPLRLVDSSNFDMSNYVGRVEILFAGIWGRICYDYPWFNIDMTATVACRQLGYTSGVMVAASHYFGPATSKVWMNNVGCSRMEKHLGYCSKYIFGISEDECNYDAGLVCFKGE